MAEKLIPTDHFIGTKRLCLDTDYYATYNRDNVALVDLKKDPIRTFTREGIKSGDTTYALDAVVFATGYDAMTGAALHMDISTTDGAKLKEKWGAVPKTYLGIMTAGFPNLFFITGPGSPSVLANMIAGIEQHVDWVADCLKYLKSKGFASIDADSGYEERWVELVNQTAASTLLPQTNSWWTGSNVPGKPRLFVPYAGGHGHYRMKCADIAFNGYEGFVLGRRVPA